MEVFSGINICFISNFTKTYVFHAVAGELMSRYNIKVFWIVVNQKYRSFLEKHYDKEHILYIHKGVGTTGSNTCVGEYKLNEIVYNDRFFKKNLDEGLHFLKAIQEPIYDFISRNKIRFVFGEATWSHEILTSRIIEDKRELNCRYFKPHVVRLPNDRFAFFPNEREELEEDPTVTYGELDFPPVKLQLQEYVKINSENIKKSYKLKARLERAKRFFTMENIEKNDPSLPYRFNQRFVRGTRQEVYKSTYRFLSRSSMDDIGDRKFILYPLHVQPEASIDVIGRYYNDQYLNILNIWKLLPEDWLLVVKEHTSGIGDRSPSFYRKVRKLPDVLIIDENTNSHALISKSELVFTVSGTVAYEAALMGKTSFTFAPMFFNKLQNCHKVTFDDFEEAHNIIDLVKTKNLENAHKMDLRTFSNFVYHHSFKGNWEPTNKITFTQENITGLADAVVTIVNRSMQ